MGKLWSFDKANINVVLSEAYERMFSLQQAVEQVYLGVLLLRGDNLAAIGMIDKEIDEQTLPNIRAGPLKTVTH
jgi:U6 snRNA-associated Sm-like protein LSm8